MTDVMMATWNAIPYERPDIPVLRWWAPTTPTQHQEPVMSNEEIPIFPVARIDSGPVPRMELFMLRFHFLTHAGQHVNEAEVGRYYALTATQLRDLIPKMQQALRTLESAGPQRGPGPRH